MTVLILLPKTTETGLDAHYARALGKAEELYIVSAYLTEWDTSIKPNKNCRTFRMIVGCDFGITRKIACQKVMRWLPARLKNRFMVAERISGFHPKAVFWREPDGSTHALIGSSNLTSAAFSRNHEANIYLPLPAAQFAQAVAWIRKLEPKCEVVSDVWLAGYEEAKALPPKARPNKAVQPDRLPRFSAEDVAELLHERRAKMALFIQHRADLLKLFKDCAEGRITNSQFYARLPNHWSWKLGNQFQASGWERRGKGSDFRLLSQCFLRIANAGVNDRDDIVAQEIDQLARHGVRCRAAFFTEMLCQWFPALYPVMNQPVKNFRTDIGYRKLKGASEGASYVYWAQCLRSALDDLKRYPARNLAELDALIWRRYHDWKK